MSFIATLWDGTLIALKQLAQQKVKNEPENEKERTILTEIETELETRRHRLNANSASHPDLTSA
jgi:hypothetical protein